MAKFVNTALAEYAQRLVKLSSQEDKVFRLALDNPTIKNLIIDLNTEKQLKEQHVDSKGETLFNTITQRSVYAPSDPLGRGGEPYEVFRTGKYYKSFKVVIKADSIVITSNPQKGSKNLFEIYTVELEGLTQQSLQILIDEALKQFIRWYKKNLLPQ